MCRANGLASYINNDNVAAYNEAITQVAADKRVVLLNTAEVYTGEDGQLPRELANDGCHFVYGEYGRWADYLRSHVIDPERYFYSRKTPELYKSRPGTQPGRLLSYIVLFFTLQSGQDARPLSLRLGLVCGVHSTPPLGLAPVLRA